MESSEKPEGDRGLPPKGVKRRRRGQSGEQDQTRVDHQSASTVKRSSRFRGVSRHRWTGRYEAHLWDKGSWNPTQRKKGKQVYLGAYDEEESAARAYDLAAIKYWGASTFTNFPVTEYEQEMEIMKGLTREEYLASLRRKSSGFSRGVSKYRGVARHHHNGRWEARIGRVFGNKYLYLGTYSTQEEAAHAYDMAAIEYRGINAVTNFDLSTYIRWLRPPLSDSIAAHETPTLPLDTNINVTSTETNKLFASPEDDGFFLPLSSSHSSSSSSSSSALGLLLKSAVFRDLVEKNNCAENEDNNNKEKSSYDALLGSEALDASGMGFGDANMGHNLIWNFPLDLLCPSSS